MERTGGVRREMREANANMTGEEEQIFVVAEIHHKVLRQAIEGKKGGKDSGGGTELINGEWSDERRRTNSL